MLRLAPSLALLVLLGPILCGLVGTVLPAFGYFPALGGMEFSLDPFRALFERPGLTRSILLSLWTGIGTTAIALSIVALFVAGWAGTRSFRTIQHLVSPLLSVPHAAAAFGLAFLIAPSGWIMRLISPEVTGLTRPPDLLILNDAMGLSMMAGLVAKEIPFLLLVTLSALPQSNAHRFGQISSSLGYGKVAGFLYTVWPGIYRQIRLAVFAVIAYATSVVDVAIILGPNNPASLAPRLLGWMNDVDLAMRFEASAGAILQLGVTAFALLFWLGLEKIASAISHYACASGRRFQRDGLMKIASATLIAIAAVTIFLGLAILAIWSFSGFWAFPDALPKSFSLKTWQRSWQGLGTPFWNTIVTGLVATIIAIAITLACLERETRTGRSGGSRALLFLYLPLIVPQVGFVFGLQLLFLIIGVNATHVALVFVHLIFVLPYVFLSLADPWRAWDNRLSNVAQGLGTSRTKIFWKVRLPMLLRATLVASAVGFAASIGQYLPTVLIGAGRLPTITTEAVALASGGDRRIIGVYAFLQMVLPFIGFALAAAIPSFLYRNRRDMRSAA